MAQRRCFFCFSALISLLSLVQSDESSEGILPKGSDLMVKGLEDIEPAFKAFEGDMYAGMIPVGTANEERGKLMFWLFAPDEPLIQDSMVLWLNGGPGCSSFKAGLLFENSPVTVQPRRAGYCCTQEREPLIVNNHSWTRSTYMLYLEQPAGTGFSYGKEPKTEDDVARDAVDWLTNFYQVFPELQSYDLHIFGESYAGMYVPSVARGIYHYNRDHNSKKKDTPRINLQGIGIGNGWLDVKTQGPAVIDYAYWHGMIDVATRNYYHREWERCYESVVTGKHEAQPEPFHAFTTGDECGILDAVLTSAGDYLLENGMGPNMYDVTTWDPYPALRDDEAAPMFHFFNDPKVQEMLHAPVGFQWHGCQVPDEDDNSRRQRRLKMLDHDRPLSVLPYIAELLDDAKIRVLVYNADLDISVSPPASEAALNSMDWNHGGREWFYADRSLWLVNDTSYDSEPDPASPMVAGYVKEVNGLSFLVVRNCGHMVPYNVPRNSLDLVTRFLRAESFVDRRLPNFAAQQASSSNEILYHGEHLRIQQDTDWNDRRKKISRGSSFLFMVAIAAVAFVSGFYLSNSPQRQGYMPVEDYNTGDDYNTTKDTPPPPPPPPPLPRSLPEGYD